uniref:ABC-type branched-chain amino acid transport system, substrate-binding protein n=1 Tax=Candidatus Kentrum sp. UNK TaxID=2126344 RepID=A0A451ABY5_9GAMM|nr:MAG: ABC-type branched-chain amino acid transport system, substrate-binding protein [Candidatus Kentron sp. UNK]VFK70852.1 MAG: ABC-type branched-chain amino acid transport system, substrate-binding protein [Candidatus Kentron sp. UNK]
MIKYINQLSRIILASVFFGLVFGCSQQEGVTAPKLVAALPLTGDLSFLGTPGKTAVEIAQKEAEKAEMPFDVSFVDTKANPKEMATILRKELDVNQNKFFIVTLSGPSLTAAESVSKDEALILSIAIHPAIPSSDQPVIRFCLSAAQEGEMLVEHLSKSNSRIGLVVSRDGATTYEVEKTIVPGLQAAEKSIAWTEWFDVGQRDFKNLAARFTSSPVDEILLLGYGSDFPSALSSLASTGKHQSLRIIGGIGFVELHKIPNGFNADQFSFLAPAFSLGLGGEKAENFRKRYLDATGKMAPYDAAYTYDAAMTFTGLLHEGKSKPKEFLDVLRNHTIQGVTGTISWDGTGEATTDIRWGTFDETGNLVPQS